MYSGKVIKGIFGKLSEQPNAQSNDTDQSLMTPQHTVANGEHHDYDPINGWVVRQNVEKRVSRFNYETLSAMH